MPRKRKHPRFPQEIRLLAARFRDHEDVTPAAVQRWLTQFGNDDTSIAMKVLREIRYYSAQDIRTMLRQLVERVYQHLTDVRQNRVIFIPAGKPYSGAVVLARALRDTPHVQRSQIKTVAELLSIPDGEVDAVVFVEDFSGTGETLTSWWANIEPAVLPKVSNVVFGVLVLNFRARERLREFSPTVVSVQELTEESNVLSDACNAFLADEKISLRRYCEKTRCSPEYRLGYGDCGLLVAFKHFCPNNSLPILWHNKNNWHNLFRRTAI